MLDVYDKLFDRALYLRGTSREELVERLTASAAAPAVAPARPALRDASSSFRRKLRK